MNNIKKSNRFLIGELTGWFLKEFSNIPVNYSPYLRISHKIMRMSSQTSRIDNLLTTKL